MSLFAGYALAQPTPDTIKVDNEFVRVLFLTNQPRTKIPLHRHPLNRIMIYLDPKVNPRNVEVEFENEYVRVSRRQDPANIREPLHEHLSENRLPFALDPGEPRCPVDCEGYICLSLNKLTTAHQRNPDTL